MAINATERKGHAMLSDFDKDVLKLIQRSPDRGDGWRSVSTTCWPLIEGFRTPELIEVDGDSKRVRLTEDGVAVVTFSL